MTWDQRLHYWGGYWMALPWWFRFMAERLKRLEQIDLYGWAREVAQHDPQLTPHQIEEAKAWGLGARKALRLPAVPFPSPPYPT